MFLGQRREEPRLLAHRQRLDEPHGAPSDQQQQASATPNSRPEKTASLGLQLSSLDPALRRQYKIPKEVEGAAVTDVAQDSPAAALGVQPSDVIESVDQQPVKSPQQAAQALRRGGSHGPAPSPSSRGDQAQLQPLVPPQLRHL